MIEAERARVLEIRSEGQVPSEIVREVLAMLDIEESLVDAGVAERSEIRAADAALVGTGGCPDLDAFPAHDADPADHTQDGDRAHDADPAGGARACTRCLAEGTTWVALRECLACGNVGCCDSSVSRHATRHFQESRHPVMQSAEPGEAWRWCYVHHATG